MCGGGVVCVQMREIISYMGAGETRKQLTDVCTPDNLDELKSCTHLNHSVCQPQCK